MADVFGVDVPMPKIDLTGFLSSSWIYVFVISLFGIILLAGVFIFFFFTTYKRKIVLFENISGKGYQPVFKSRARGVKLGSGGEEILKTLFGGHFISAYGRKMGKNTYWYCKGQDGYWYNCLLGDLDTKQAMLDIEPVDRDVRMFHVALDRLSHQTYGKNSFMEKYGGHVFLFLFLVVLILGIWFIVGKIGDATAPLAQSTELAVKIQEANERTLERLDSVVRSLGYLDSGGGDSGIVPA